MWRLAVFLAILSGAYSYLFLSWVAALGLQGSSAWLSALALFAPFACILWMIVIIWQRDEERENASDIFVYWTAVSSMGLLSLTLALTALRDIGLTGLKILHISVPPLDSSVSFWAILALSAILFFVGAVIARYHFDIPEIDIAIEDLPEALVGFRIAQISDLHIGAMIGAPFVKRVVAHVNAVQADVVVLTGDIVDGYYGKLKSVVTELGEIRAKEARYYITGNHEYYWGATPIIEGFRELGFRALINESDTLTRAGASIVIAGVPDYMSAQTGGPKPDVAKPLENTQKTALKVLLAHQPSFAEKASQAGYDLQLSGHTHGGQFFPWIYVVRLVHSFSGGLGKSGKMWIYVNRGTGFWGPPLRLGARPEITVIRFRRK